MLKNIHKKFKIRDTNYFNAHPEEHKQSKKHRAKKNLKRNESNDIYLQSGNIHDLQRVGPSKVNTGKLSSSG